MTSTATTPLAATDRGTGEPALVFLPGWCGDRSVFDELVVGTAERRRALSVDWPGHGDTPAAPADFTTTDLVDRTLDLLEQADVHRVVPVALSHAGWVAVELRRRLGAERVPAVVLLDWMVLGPPPPFLDALEGLQRQESWEQTRAALFDMWTRGLDIPPLIDYVAGMGAHGFDMWARAGREIAASFRAEGSPLEALGALEPPPRTLHLYAQPESAEVLAAQQGFAAEHAWFAVHRLDARSHFPMFEVPREMSALVEQFVASLP